MLPDKRLDDVVETGLRHPNVDLRTQVFSEWKHRRLIAHAAGRYHLCVPVIVRIDFLPVDNLQRQPPRNQNVTALWAKVQSALLLTFKSQPENWLCENITQANPDYVP